MRKKCKRPLTFLLALLLFFSLTGASVQAEESTKAGSSDKAQTVVIQEDSTQKEDDVGAAASTEENVQQELPEISSNELQQEESRKGESDKTEGNDALQEKISSENQTGETVNDSDEEKDAQNAAGSITVAIQDDIENTGTLTAQLSGNVSNGITLEWYKHAEGSNTWTRVV